MSNEEISERIQTLRRELEDELGCAVIIWTKHDYPGKDDDERGARFAEHVDGLCERLVQAGNELIGVKYG